MLELTVTSSDDGTLYKCMVDVPGGDAILEDVLEVETCKFVFLSVVFYCLFLIFELSALPKLAVIVF